MNLLFTILLLFSFNLVAGTITITGVSEVSKSPDFLKFEISAETKCYETAKSSNDAIVELSSELRKILESQLSLSNGDKLFSNSGITIRRREIISVYDEVTKSYKNIVLCEKGWSSSRILSVQLQDFDIWNTLNPALLEKVDQLEKEKPGENNASITASISSPTPGLEKESIEMMRKDALVEALTKASQQFNLIKSLCNLENTSIVKLSGMPQPIYEINFASKMPSSDAIDVLSFDNLKVRLSWDITWNFENTNGNCASSYPIIL